MSPVAVLISSLIIWTVAWGVFGYCALMRGTNYVRGYVKTTIYFLTVGACTAALFWRSLSSFIQPIQWQAVGILIVFMSLQLCLYMILFRKFPRDADYFLQYPMREYLSVNPRRLVSKSADIFAQQVFIVLIIISLRNIDLSLTQVTLWFGLLFALMHIPPIAREWGEWPALTFSGAVVLFSALFPTIILTVPYGFIYTFIIHWLFYTGIAIGFWYLRARTDR
ncbi:MAG: hypothetical protein JWL88_462 [Parcubacteria group bacterium]|nr:hypothetical protein [Parcubacteria group bacterium]